VIALGHRAHDIETRVIALCGMYIKVFIFDVYFRAITLEFWQTIQVLPICLIASEIFVNKMLKTAKIAMGLSCQIEHTPVNDEF
jgi:hypothetical protein